MAVATRDAPALCTAVYPLTGEASDYDPFVAGAVRGRGGAGWLQYSPWHGDGCLPFECPAERKQVRPGLSGSWEALFHGLDIPAFLLPLTGPPSLDEVLNRNRLERAIGVIYRPETERTSHYFEARLQEQFCALIHFDRTHAVEPLDRTAGWDVGEPPETYPTGL